MNKVVQLLAVVVVALALSACGNSGFVKDGNVVSFSVDSANYRIELCSESMVHVRMAASGAGFDANEDWMVAKYDWAPVEYSVSTSQGFITKKTAAMTVEVQQSPFWVAVYNKQNQLINTDALIGLYAELSGRTPLMPCMGIATLLL
jgi:alpha-glucosidase